MHRVTQAAVKPVSFWEFPSRRHARRRLQEHPIPVVDRRFIWSCLALGIRTYTLVLGRGPMDSVLVIEDSRAMQRTLQRLFESDSLLVLIASYGVAGLEMVCQLPPLRRSLSL